jgi:hypothetical protein
VDISDLIDLRQNTVNLSMRNKDGDGTFNGLGISVPGADQSMDLDAEVLSNRMSPNKRSPILSPKRSPTMREEPEIRPFADDKKVKDGVDILKLDQDKILTDCDSSLELILITLSKAFSMKPKQAAALLTNNN